MTIYENKIRADYSNVANFSRKEGINKNVYYALKNKKTDRTIEGSKSDLLCKKLRKMGYMPSVEKN